MVRIGCIALVVAYLLGIATWIIVEIEIMNEDYFQTKGVNFIEEVIPGKFFDTTDKSSQSRNLIAVFYFAFTTLTTVGFGDLRPYSNLERIITAFVLLFGVLIFSYIIGNFLDVIDAYDIVVAENEDADNLSRFFGILQKYNNGRLLKKEFTTEIEDYFEYYWSNDKLYSVATEEDHRYFDELPQSIKTEIFKNFLFKPFIQTFKKMFELRKNLKIQHSYYKWDDDIYSEFMITLMKLLEPRKYQDGEMIYQEL